VYPFLSANVNYSFIAGTAGFELVHFLTPNSSGDTTYSLFAYAGGGIQLGAGSTGGFAGSVTANLGMGYVYDAEGPGDYTEWFVSLALSFSAVGQTSSDILKAVQIAPQAGGPIFSVNPAKTPFATSAGFSVFFSPTSHVTSSGNSVYANGFTPITSSAGIGTPSAASKLPSFNVSLTWYWELKSFSVISMPLSSFPQANGAVGGAILNCMSNPACNWDDFIE
jgi:hypothetical protein